MHVHPQVMISFRTENINKDFKVPTVLGGASISLNTPETPVLANDNDDDDDDDN